MACAVALPRRPSDRRPLRPELRPTTRRPMAMGGDGGPPPAGSGPFVRSDHAAGSFWEVSKLALLGLTVAPLRLVLWLALVWPIYPLCRAMCTSPQPTAVSLSAPPPALS